MFHGCTDFNLKNSKYLNSMFEGYIALKNITTRNFKTSSAIDISTMLKDCSSVSSLDLNKINTNIINFIDVTKFGSSQVEDMSYMINYCNCLSEYNLANLIKDSKNMVYML